MKVANIADFKNHMSRYMKQVVSGDIVRICHRNVAIADVVPIRTTGPNQTRLGCGMGSAMIKVDLTEPVLDPSDCESLLLK